MSSGPDGIVFGRKVRVCLPRQATFLCPKCKQYRKVFLLDDHIKPDPDCPTLQCVDCSTQYRVELIEVPI